jgi:hypothetical protein
VVKERPACLDLEQQDAAAKLRGKERLDFGYGRGVRGQSRPKGPVEPRPHDRNVVDVVHRLRPGGPAALGEHVGLDACTIGETFFPQDIEKRVKLHDLAQPGDRHGASGRDRGGLARDRNRHGKERRKGET